MARIMTPAERWLLIDENPYSINDGMFVCDIAAVRNWVDIPASYHVHGAALNFADGHSEIKVWRDSAVVGFTSLIAPSAWPQTTVHSEWRFAVVLQQRSNKLCTMICDGRALFYITCMFNPAASCGRAVATAAYAACFFFIASLLQGI